MTNEEMQRTMQFILEQQAQFAVDIQQLKESQAKTEGNVGQLTNVVSLLAAATNAGFQELRGGIAALIDTQLRNEENIKNLTAVVDRYFRERNGQKDSA
jgi:transcriptional regulator with AAA-type ATPase domain